MSKKEEFDWSKIDRNMLISLIWDLKELFKNRVSVSEFHTNISKTIKSTLPINIRRFYNKAVPEGVVYIGGTYFSHYDQNNKISINLDLMYNNKKDSFFLDTRRFKSICSSIADTILHEIIHMRQYRRRNFKFLPDYASNAEKTEQRHEQSYLGCSDEIDAYGFNIACELTEKFKGNQKKIIKYLAENQKNKKRKFNSWRMYQQAFNYDHSHPIIRRLKKKVIRYLPHAQAGKPYKNKDWINW